MRYVSIDIETTGLDYERHQILEIGAVIDDFEKIIPITELPYFHCYVNHEEIVGQPYALSLNCEILKKISDHDTEKYTILEPEEIAVAFKEFLTKNRLEKINCAGKNFATFDKLFLQKLPRWNELIQIRHRVIDLAMLYFDPKTHKDVLPSLADCMEAAGMIGGVSHTALNDALVIVQLLRYKYKNM